MNGSALKIFSGNANIPLAREICDKAGITLGHMDTIKFSNENIKVTVRESVRGADIFVVQPSCSPVNEGVMELLIIIDALKHASAGRITAVCPYFPYVRSDKKDEPRISITARLMADLLETAGADRVLTMNLHSSQVQGFFRINCDHLSAGNILIDYIKETVKLENTVVVAADAGSAKRAVRYAERMQLPLAILEKRRVDDSETAKVFNVIGEVKGMNVLIFDDEISTAGTMCEVIAALTKIGVGDIRIAAVHGVLCGPAAERLKNAPVKEIIVTNTVFIPPEKMLPNMTVLSVAEPLAEAIRRIHNHESVGEIFKLRH
ncbi:MAG: ribose-phosphate pyrophosphokinase [Candidatus Raymondbacteria bacterium RifOxyA12_full_50_37]|uniref:ribose-phosphate diphosphokinase n=1 Tax=Candidatus Raymondbacteria bacterium RIFOXYD12_FULL_49_13 TaxID=1817890 RepID=A0A1F7F0P9_UNCRA|nr:MAG: ribose-phosphate pyrophosphokinase [Candidatus Raymondbacteria bacterium RifOxyA12_full_50_37]OGJ86056.1 MAG: ribose-phosphate pyrophosphokinase [Candidatus Raymondbacteria bacterium RIFOXYA2_FULL_49_16]OGJ95953.1 MAG: ribose-phosphate pyrophosphokinase [Candidatus Raymondbacteria bacterium RIFOXYC2_FULL_50_21]OGK00198.1 MAG: ribose-phosphate pyrophosphokinase [Candidatus Raymondbacteria bacterium RIFOXYD12_FULL_49_13]OGK03901.1 MAG: ribose-phosphate pyrophosphokinase [Candidatus Raymon